MDDFQGQGAQDRVGSKDLLNISPSHSQHSQSDQDPKSTNGPPSPCQSAQSSGAIEDQTPTVSNTRTTRSSTQYLLHCSHTIKRHEMIDLQIATVAQTPNLESPEIFSQTLLQALRFHPVPDRSVALPLCLHRANPVARGRRLSLRTFRAARASPIIQPQRQHQRRSQGTTATEIHTIVDTSTQDKSTSQLQRTNQSENQKGHKSCYKLLEVSIGNKTMYLRKHARQSRAATPNFAESQLKDIKEELKSSIEHQKSPSPKTKASEAGIYNRSPSRSCRSIGKGNWLFTPPKTPFTFSATTDEYLQQDQIFLPTVDRTI
jgi:hypothetical protein